MSATKWINEDFEKNIKLWHEQVKAGNTDTLYLELKNDNDFLVLQNFFLICQKEQDKSLYLKIRCVSNSDEIYRIRHYLYACHNMAKDIVINGCHYEMKKPVKFFRISPLISIDRNNFDFLSKRICDIENELNVSIGRDMLNRIMTTSEYQGKLTVEQRCLLQVSLTGLYGEIDGFKAFSDYRIEYFEDITFKNKIRNIPFLAFFIFSIYDRINHEELAEEYKDKKTIIENKKRCVMKVSEMTDALPTDDEILADIFNSWDLSDGILQLIENVVEHAGTKLHNLTQNGKERKRDGRGVLSIRIHTNSEDNTYLKNEYDQYFKGYENNYKEEYIKRKGAGLIELTEKQYFRECHSELRMHVNRGRFIEESVLKNYESIRQKIDERRQSRMSIEHFLEIQIADISGKNMCNVFRDNLKFQKYKRYSDFDKINVRSFFNPNDSEKKKFQEYYQEKNIVHHYGLQIFTSIVLNNDGYFCVRSHSKHDKSEIIYDTTKDINVNIKDLMEGTRYRILLPFRRQTIHENNSMVNADIIYHENLEVERKVLDVSDDKIKRFYRMLREYTAVLQTKEEIVSELSDFLQNLNNEESNIIVFDIDHITSDKLEIFCKSIILYIASNSTRNHKNDIAVVNCSTQDFVGIVRIFSVCYDKNGMGDWMKSTQVYLCGKDTREEFLISGNSIHTLLTRVEKLAFSRKIHPMCIQILRKILEKKRKDGKALSENEDFNYTPFDLLLKKDGRSIFENNVKMVLENNIQGIESGCRVETTHMRLGSKIHMDMFYEAELLFYNNYYTSRFASLIYHKLKGDSKKAEKKFEETSICLIGYETYSEMFLYELKNILMRKSIICEYIVYEIKTDGTINLRYKENVRPEMKGILVIPISSTLTTFNKVYIEVNRKLPGLKIQAYLGVVQVLDNSEKVTEDGRTEIERFYWDEIDLKNRRIYSRRLLGDGNGMDYLVEVECRWDNPLKCKQCFPDDCLLETPLIETNKTSVVPTQLIGLKGEVNAEKDIVPEPIVCNGKVESLKNYFYHGHIYRNDNHFCYYIRTAAYYQDHKEEIKNWLEGIRNSILDKKCNHNAVFNIIVSPMHFSNTGFMEAVNEVVFKGASYVLRIESEKEFRDNIQTKYSDLTILYYNLMKTGNSAVINFYYVDDNIITGKSFYRIKHLVKSLFAGKNESNIQINIFKSIIVLLNRMSRFSVANYVSR